MNAIVKVDNVGMAFETKKGRFVALKDVNLQIRSGEVVSLIGHSGCGKSTLLNLIAGLTLPTSGAMDGADPLLGHKTSRRARYDAAIAAATREGAFDLLFRNRQGLLTEGGRTNLFLYLDGRWLTPPLAAGVLPGVMRGLILADPAWAAREAALTLADLRRADRIMVCNALRGPVDARLVE